MITFVVKEDDKPLDIGDLYIAGDDCVIFLFDDATFLNVLSIILCEEDDFSVENLLPSFINLKKQNETIIKTIIIPRGVHYYTFTIDNIDTEFSTIKARE